MNKKIMTMAMALMLLAGVSYGATTSVKQKFIDANKSVVNQIKSEQTAIAKSKANAADAKVQKKITKLNNKIAKKQAEITKINNDNKMAAEKKAEKVRQIRADIRELQAEIRTLK